MLDKNNLVALAKVVAKADPSAPTSYSWKGESLSYEALNETLRTEFKELAGTYALYRENKNVIFSIIEEVMNDVLPKKVVDRLLRLRPLLRVISPSLLASFLPMPVLSSL